MRYRAIVAVKEKSQPGDPKQPITVLFDGCSSR